MSAIYFFDQIRQHITRGDLNAALLQLRDLMENAKELDEVILQQGRYSAIRKMIRLGIVSHPEATLEQNQIAAALLELMRELETQGAKPEYKAGLERAVAIVNSKNVVQGNQISQGQNSLIHIGDVINLVGQSATGKPAHQFNLKLTRALVEAMAPYNEKAQTLVSLGFQWIDQPENLLKVQRFVFQNFVGEIGKQLRRLIHIGEYEQMENAKKQQHFAEKCLDIARRSFDLVNYTLLSVWWDIAKSNPHTLEPAEREILENFFEAHLEYDLRGQLRLMHTLCALFQRFEAPFPFEGRLEGLLPVLAEGSPLYNACAELEQAGRTGNSLEAEVQLCAIMPHFAFLTLYRMASLKRITYRRMRNGQPEFLHRYVAVGIDINYSEDAEKGSWKDFGEQTPAVLLYQGEHYQNGINLFPFVIDYNALTFEQGAKICFYSSRDFHQDNTLAYRFLGDNSLISIRKKGIHTPQTNLDELMMDKELLKSLNLDCVVDGFKDARQAILNIQTNIFESL